MSSLSMASGLGGLLPLLHLVVTHFVGPNLKLYPILMAKEFEPPTYFMRTYLSFIQHVSS